MSRSASPNGFAARRTVNLGDPPETPRPLPASSPSRPELEKELAGLREENADLHAALFEALQVYRRLCPPRFVRYRDFEIASEIFAVRYLPGDFFTVQESQDGLIMALGDVCGKGLGAGMWTTHLVGLVGSHAAAHVDPRTTLTGINRDLCRMAAVAPLASLFLARLDPLTGVLEYSSAGHPPVIVLRENGRLETLYEGGPLLGVLPSASFAKGKVFLDRGDLLLAYSDGILESRNAAEQEFGFERLERNLRSARDASADRILFSVLGAVQDFAGARPQEDDMSLVIVRRA
jgi:sigma-B regulation protein RsbU (phosphoserine phosphatase)